MPVSFHQCFIIHILFTSYRRYIILTFEGVFVLWNHGKLLASEYLFDRVLEQVFRALFLRWLTAYAMARLLKNENLLSSI